MSREQFTRCLIQLNLLEPPVSAAASPSSSVKSPQRSSNGPLVYKPTIFFLNYFAECLLNVMYFMFFLFQCSEVKSFHESPVALESRLAKNAVTFLKNGLDTDMSFEIVSTSQGMI